MTPYTLLLPGNLTPTESRMLYAALTSQQVPRPSNSINVEDPTSRQIHKAPIVLSVGKGALDWWHEWGLIRLGRQHGTSYVHHRRLFYVVEHPGAMLQMEFGGRTARDQMAADLQVFRWLLEGKVRHEDTQTKLCGACLKARKQRSREAVEWPSEVDGVGLCEDHRRRMSQLTKRPKPRLNPSSREAQMKGQVEMWG